MKPLRVGIAGLGAVGLKVAQWLDSEQANATAPRLSLAAVSASSDASAQTKLTGFSTAPIICPASDLAAHTDIVVECLPPAVFRGLAEPTIRAGKILMPLSVTQLLENWDLVDLAEKAGARIIVPTGALLGLDAVRAATEGTLRSVTMKTRKPPSGLAKAPFVLEQGLDLAGLDAPMSLYTGSVRDAAQKFPANVNVAVALALAGLGPDATQYEIWADPEVTRNTHSIEVEAEEVSFTMSIAGVPTVENPATGKLTPLSTIAALKAMVQTLKVGS